MALLYKLHNQIKHYEWGSHSLLPEFLGVENRDGSPWAEMWMGTHPASPSEAEAGAGTVNLAQAAGELPFLFKLLAVERQLSIQAHPNLHQAQEGFRRENDAGLAPDAAQRNYRDANHKPEIICALSRFTAMAGFREFEQIRASFDEFASVAQLKETFIPLLRALESDSLKDFFRTLFEPSKNEIEKVCNFILQNETCGAVLPEQWNLMKELAAQYPADAGVLSPLYLNLFTLEPGQAVFVPAGILHSYIRGFGVELMANSDNVLRAGLTPKHTDISEMMNILEFKPFMPQIISPSSSSHFRYPSPCDDFSLSILRGGENTGEGGSICIITEGELQAGNITFKKGESFFLPPCGDLPSFSGNYSLFAASGTAAFGAS